MSEERLEEIKEQLRHDLVHNDGMLLSVNCGNVKWLIKQAERIKELEDLNSLADDTINLIKDKNQRYKQALEFYADKKRYLRDEMLKREGNKPLMVSSVDVDGGERANKALNQ